MKQAHGKPISIMLFIVLMLLSLTISLSAQDAPPSGGNVAAAQRDTQQPVSSMRDSRASVLSAIYNVNTKNDTPDASVGDGVCGDASGLCSLRAAITEANFSAGTIDRINIPAGRYKLTRSDNNFPEEDNNFVGDLDIRSEIDIWGAGKGLTIIDVNGWEMGLDFFLGDGTFTKYVTVNDLTIRGGRNNTQTFGDGVVYVAGGTRVYFENVDVIDNVNTLAVYVFGILHFTSGSVSNNSNTGSAGAWHNDEGASYIINSTISNNSATGVGGALVNDTSGYMDIRGSLIYGNKSGSDGGAIWATSFGNNVWIDNSTLSGNSARRGGAIAGGEFYINNSTLSWNSAPVAGFNSGWGGAVFFRNAYAEINNSTISNNYAADAGGGIYHFTVIDYSNDFLSIHNSTVTANKAPKGGGAYIYDSNLRFRNSILAGNIITVSQGLDCFTETGLSIVSQGYNILGNNNNCAGFNHPEDKINVNPLLSTLADNGGGTCSHLPGVGSPAINAGNNALIPRDWYDMNSNGQTTDTAPFDQRGWGYPRVNNSVVDIGAIETGDVAVPTGLPCFFAQSTELVLNGGFETQGASASLPANWTGVSLYTDRRKCDGTKIKSYAGNCFLNMTVSANYVSSFKQTINSPSVKANDLMTLNAYVAPKGMPAAGGRIQAVITHNDGTKTKLRLNVPTGTSGYTSLIASKQITKSVSKIVVLIKETGSTGSFRVDQVSLINTPTSAAFGASTAAPEGLLPLPAMPLDNGS